MTVDAEQSPEALRCVDLSIAYSRRAAPVVKDVNMNIGASECVGLVGESGSGKSSIIKAITGLAPVRSGRILVHGHDVTGQPPGKRRSLGGRVCMVMQEPRLSMNPRMTIGQTIDEAVHLARSTASDGDSVVDLLARVRLSPELAARYPAEVSGGQLQRAAIARAIATGPSLILLDEVTASLDVTTQVAVLDLLRELRQDLGLSYLFVSHDLAVVNDMCNRTYVMSQGEIVEEGLTAQLFENPTQAYTRELLNAVPALGRNRWIRKGERETDDFLTG